MVAIVCNEKILYEMHAVLAAYFIYFDPLYYRQRRQRTARLREAEAANHHCIQVGLYRM